MDLSIFRTTMSNLHQSTPTVIHPGGPQRGARPGVRRRWKRWYLPMQSCVDSASANSRFSVFFGARFWRKWLGNGWKPQCSVLEDVTNIYKFTTKMTQMQVNIFHLGLPYLPAAIRCPERQDLRTVVAILDDVATHGTQGGRLRPEKQSPIKFHPLITLKPTWNQSYQRWGWTNC